MPSKYPFVERWCYPSCCSPEFGEAKTTGQYRAKCSRNFFDMAVQSGVDTKASGPVGSEWSVFASNSPGSSSTMKRSFGALGVRTVASNPWWGKYDTANHAR